MGTPHDLVLAPSILAGDHACLEKGLEAITAVPVRWLHLDIMDGHFVPNLSFGPQTVADLRERNSTLFFDTHLMLSNPHEHLDAFIKAGSNNITIHLEPSYDIPGTLQRIHEAGVQCGIALNPATPAEAALPYLSEVDLVLVMTVWPGFGGQSFIEETLPKIETLANWRAGAKHRFRLEVDGGIDLATAARCRSSGADTFVAGTAFFKAADPAEFLRAISG